MLGTVSTGRVPRNLDLMMRERNGFNKHENGAPRSFLDADVQSPWLLQSPVCPVQQNLFSFSVQTHRFFLVKFLPKLNVCLIIDYAATVPWEKVDNWDKYDGSRFFFRVVKAH